MRNRVMWAAAVGALGVVACLPAFDNGFIADDYAFLMYVQPVAESWRALADIPLGLRRLTSSLFFYFCFALFGLNPVGYYAANLLLHLANTALVWLLVRELTNHRQVALVAALFFVAYERHHEPMFWIAAHHELLLSLGLLATVYFFGRFRRRGRWPDYALALAAFAFSAVSKESFVVLPPLLMLLELCFYTIPARRQWLLHAPFWLAGGAYLIQMQLAAEANRFYATYYGISPHFFVVYPLSLHRLLLFVYLFLLLAAVAGWRGGGGQRLRAALGEKPFLFFAGWLLVTPVPYCFLLYLDELPSRQTYIPSVATAALVALLYARAHEWATAKSWQPVATALLALCLLGNIAYLWTRKDADFVARAAPTEQLIALLNREAARIGSSQVVIYDFPYEKTVARAAAEFFTPVTPKQLRFRKGKEPPPAEDAYLLRWNVTTLAYEAVRRSS